MLVCIVYESQDSHWNFGSKHLWFHQAIKPFEDRSCLVQAELRGEGFPVKTRQNPQKPTYTPRQTNMKWKEKQQQFESMYLLLENGDFSVPVMLVFGGVVRPSFGDLFIGLLDDEVGNCHTPVAVARLGAFLLMEETLRTSWGLGSLPRYLQGFIYARWCRISSINSRCSTKCAVPGPWYHDKSLNKKQIDARSKK